MIRSAIHNRRAIQTASVLLALCIVFQLGSCPCGCLEHNFWLQAFGLADDHHDHDVLADASMDGDKAVGVIVSDSSDHDCTGKPVALYVNNAQTVAVPGLDFASLGMWADGQHRMSELYAPGLCHRKEKPSRSPPGLCGLRRYAEIEVLLL